MAAANIRLSSALERLANQLQGGVLAALALMRVWDSGCPSMGLKVMPRGGRAPARPAALAC